MLTNQHRYAKQMIHPAARRDYQMAMCGLCHGLGDRYGQTSRLLTNHEMILLNMLTGAQCETPDPVIMRRCPLNPILQVRTNQNNGSAFTSAITVLLANASIEDDISDGQGLNLLARMLRLWFSSSRRKALQTLEDLDFDYRPIVNLNHAQTKAETRASGDPTQPTAVLTASIFSMTAQIAGNLQNQQALAAVGANYGSYLYLLDAFRDFPEDIYTNQFTPLRPFHRQEAQITVLSLDGVSWLLKQFEAIAAAIRLHIEQVRLYRYQDTIYKLLCEPVDRIVRRLSRVVDSNEPIRFAAATSGNALKSALLLSPINHGNSTISIERFISASLESDEPSTEENVPLRKRKKKEETEPDVLDNCVDCLCCGGCTGDRSTSACRCACCCDDACCHCNDACCCGDSDGGGCCGGGDCGGDCGGGDC